MKNKLIALAGALALAVSLYAQSGHTQDVLTPFVVGHRYGVDDKISSLCWRSIPTVG